MQAVMQSQLHIYHDMRYNYSQHFLCLRNSFLSIVDVIVLLCILNDTVFTVELLLQSITFCSMPAVDSTSEHELCQRTRKPCSEHRTVSGSMHRQYCVQRIRLGSHGVSGSTVLAEWDLVWSTRHLDRRHSLCAQQTMCR